MAPAATWNAREADEAQHAWKLPKATTDSATPLREAAWNFGNGMSSGVLGTIRSVKRIGTTKAPSSETDDNDPQATVLRLAVSNGLQQVPTPRRFPASLAALRSLRSNDSAANWSETAVTLKRDAVRLRRTPYSRHASILLALADALTFTEPTDPTLDAQARTALEHSLAVLTEPHVPEAAEEALLVSLLSHGWNLTPSVTEEPPEV